MLKKNSVIKIKKKKKKKNTTFKMTRWDGISKVGNKHMGAK